MSFDLEKFLPYRLFQAAEYTSHAFSASYREAFGITRTEWRVLFNIGQYGPISAADIARRSGLAKPKISRAVYSLEERGWINRIHNRENRRTHSLRLSEEGELTVRKLKELASEFDARLKEQLGKQKVDDLNQTLLRVERTRLTD